MFEAIETDRLLIRHPKLEDLDALLARRNEPQTAEYQDWTLPYPRERAEKLLTEAVAMEGLTKGEWWMATIESRSDGDTPGAIVGDLAIHLGATGHSAEIGYSLAFGFRGKGYATEAATALVNHLFDVVGVVKISAMLHPDNTASARVLERTGFVFEGLTKASFSLGEGDDAEISDDLHYGLTIADRDAWAARPTAPPTSVELIEITTDNQYEVSTLATHYSQRRFVSPVAESYGDALFPELENGHPVTPWLRAIQADGQLAGFVMVAWSGEHHPNPYLWRFMIDRRFQRRGIGDRALDLVEQACRANGDSTMEVSWEEGHGSPRPFYEARGYIPTGRIIDGETEGTKSLRVS